ncbi:MAG: hypothetical protein HY020_00880 [Burkholderiales bacterium]|nr:hypothetical protein [Burkholderiales bacterium]
MGQRFGWHANVWRLLRISSTMRTHAVLRTTMTAAIAIDQRGGHHLIRLEDARSAWQARFRQVKDERTYPLVGGLYVQAATVPAAVECTNLFPFFHRFLRRQEDGSPPCLHPREFLLLWEIRSFQAMSPLKFLGS